MLRHLILAALAYNAMSLQIEEEDDVLVLTDENFDEAIKEYDPLLVAFVAPWCGHCKHLKPEFAKAAKTLKGKDLRLAKVDATENRDLSSRFDVAGFPTLKFFRGGQPSEYNGGREADSITNWVIKKSGPAATAVASVAEADAFEAANSVAVIGVFAAGSEGEKAFLAAAARTDDLPFALSSSAEVAAKYNLASGEGVVAVNDFEGQANLVTFSGAVDAAEISKWAIGNSLPAVVTFSQQVAPKIFRGDIKTHFLLFADAEDAGAGAAAMSAFRAAALSTGAGKYLFVNVPPSESRVLEFFAITGKDLPTAVLVNMGDSSSMKKFKYTGAMDATDAFTDFLAQYDAGALKPFLKSAEAPDAEAEAAAPVKTIVGTTFEPLVLAADKDVLLEVYAPWCGHCKQLAPIYETLGETVAAAGLSDKLVIAKMDGTANEFDFPGVNVRGFPTIVFFPAGAEKKSVEYDGSRDLEGFIKFLKANAANTEVAEKLEAATVVTEEEEEEDEEGEAEL